MERNFNGPSTNSNVCGTKNRNITSSEVDHNSHISNISFDDKWLESFYFSDESDASDGETSQEVGIEYGHDGYMYIDFGYVFVKRYSAIRKLGWGHFSTVWLCWDIVDKRFVALKILKSKPSYMGLAYDEIELLKILAKTDPHHEGYHHTIRFYDFFKVTTYNGTHMCMVFEVSGVNMLPVIKHYFHKNEGPIVPIHLLRRIALHLLRGLSYVNGVCRLIHTDIKPENVVMSLDQCEIMKMAQKSYYYHYRGILPKKYASNIDSHSLKDFYRWSNKMYNSHQQHKHTSKSSVTGDNNTTEKLPFFLDNNKIMALQQRHIKNCHNIIDKKAQNCSSSLLSNRTKSLSLHNRTFKFCDFGNACYINKHFSDHIQTYEYQSPEVILDAGYDESADIWSLACTIFELATGEYLFEPRPNDDYSREDDHLSMIIELMGVQDFQSLTHGHKFKHYFHRKLQLRRIEHPSSWKLHNVLIEKYGWHRDEAVEFADFLSPMLVIDPRKRHSPHSCLKHPWLYKNRV